MHPKIQINFVILSLSATCLNLLVLPHIRDNILDLVLSATPDLIHDISVDPDSNSIIPSDHFIISFDIMCF